MSPRTASVSLLTSIHGPSKWAMKMEHYKALGSTSNIVPKLFCVPFVLVIRNVPSAVSHQRRRGIRESGVEREDEA